MPINSLNRTPAAIVGHAAGYARPMERDEAGTHGRLKIAAWIANADSATPRGWGSVPYGCGPQDRPTFTT
jgi:hypothetical protein